MKKVLNEMIKWMWNHVDIILFSLGAIYFSVSIILFIIFAFDPVFFKPGQGLNPELAEQFGSFIGGLFGTLVGVISTFFLVYTLIIQSKTNRKNQIESAFYKLIDYHKDNVQKLVIHGEKFRVVDSEVFLVLEKKFDKIFESVKAHSGIVDEINQIDIAYLLLFYGFDSNNNEILKNKINKYFTSITFDNFIQEMTYNTPNILYKGNSISINESNEFQLGHYFRNLYNTYKIIDDDKTLTKKEKKFYLKILRTQLSTPEVWIILINSLSQLGKSFKSSGYIDKYEIIKNLPKDYSITFDFMSHYSDIQYEFMETDG